MATSGVRTFDPQFAEILSEAFSRVLIRPANVVAEHIEEAIRSANLMLTEFVGRGVAQYQLVESVITLVAGTATYNLPAGTLDAWHVVVREGDQDTVVWPMGRDAYYGLPDKTNQGRPNSYFVEKGKVGDTTRTISFWPVPDGVSADTARVWVWRLPETITKLSETLSVAREWVDAYAANLAHRLAIKFAKDLVKDRKLESDEAFAVARSGARERAPLRMRMVGYVGHGKKF